MHLEQRIYYNSDDDWYSQSFHYNLGPTPTIAELQMVDYYEFDDQAKFDLGFTHVEWMDGSTPRHDDFPGIDSFDSPKYVVRMNMTRIDWSMQLANCSASHIINLYYWDWVS
jgi:hypothetical protein